MLAKHGAVMRASCRRMHCSKPLAATRIAWRPPRRYRIGLHSLCPFLSILLPVDLSPESSIVVPSRADNLMITSHTVRAPRYPCQHSPSVKPRCTWS